ncbi:MAG: hypothetical protein CMK59_03585 [Proteobacteria bacterium]|nr:hypothetical protein [Pseudomonadota bacterium]
MSTKPSRAQIAEMILNGTPIPTQYAKEIFQDFPPQLIFGAKESLSLNSNITLSLQEEHLHSKTNQHWSNQLIWGDTKEVLKTLLNESMENINNAGGIKLIYLDPPFNVGSDFFMEHKIGAKNHKLKIKAYKDRWFNGLNEYLGMMYPILQLCHKILANDGTLFLHCGHQTSAHLRLILDEIFGVNHFLNEIIYAYGAGGNPNNYFPRKHDSILWYSKSNNHTFSTQAPILRVPYDHSTLKTHYKKRDEDGRLYRDQTVGNKTYRSYADRGKRVTDVWSDLGAQNARSPISEESTGYPTQKPERLLERIICAATLPGDLIADFFCGSGTTLCVADRLNRNWIGCDSGFLGVHTTKKRLLKNQVSFSLKRGLYKNSESPPYQNINDLEQTKKASPICVESPRLVCSDSRILLVKKYQICSAINDLDINVPLFNPIFQFHRSEDGISVEMKELGIGSEYVESKYFLIKNKSLYQKIKKRKILPTLTQLTEHWKDWLDLWSISKGRTKTTSPIWNSYRLGRSQTLSFCSPPLQFQPSSIVGIQIFTIFGHELRLELHIPNLKINESKTMMWSDPEKSVPIPR